MNNKSDKSHKESLARVNTVFIDLGSELILQFESSAYEEAYWMLNFPSGDSTNVSDDAAHALIAAYNGGKTQLKVSDYLMTEEEISELKREINKFELGYE